MIKYLFFKDQFTYYACMNKSRINFLNSKKYIL